ncbi:hypothetical protein G7Y31_06720 [Corynebacterium lizhenjunii]|uniref:Uncharacterized protein n=2 Tax=Corynebacterium lizhenjunii TaxID=2709394 RepID=A0A7T0KD03_9CORY|nr:hypothetical protein [Corynebacterium lizhenjunii]QPK78277.1 hypothetical protein G7Y31_06720 [Corynebacterium lizhenjunii]
MPGPPPNPNARRKNARPDWVALPPQGRTGKTPAWPLPGRAPRGWVALWRLPQAVMWEQLKFETQVGMYLLARNTAQDLLLAGEPNGALLSEVRQMEDRLGLSPMALKRLQWEIGGASPVSDDQDGVVIEANERFARL